MIELFLQGRAKKGRDDENRGNFRIYNDLIQKKKKEGKETKSDKLKDSQILHREKTLP